MEPMNINISIEERLKNAYKSKNGLYPHEIIVLSYASKYKVNENSFPRFWNMQYGLNDKKMNMILYRLCENGFTKYVETKNALYRQKVPELKTFLKNHSIRISGKKDDLVERIVQNFPEDEICRCFPDKFYELTDLGKCELENNEIYLWFANHWMYNIDMWDVNKWIYMNQDLAPIETVSSEIKNKLQSALEQKQYGDYCLNAGSAIYFFRDYKKFDDALKVLARMIYLEINKARMSQSDFFLKYNDLKAIFSYRKGVSLPSHLILRLHDLKNDLQLDDDQLLKQLCETIEDVSLPIEIFTKKECAEIALYEMQGESERIEQMYTVAVNRMIEKLSAPKELTEKEKEMQEKKEQILLNSFNALKDDIKTNHEQLGKILAQLQASQPETVVELWKYMLDNNWDSVVNDTDTYNSVSIYLTANLMKELTDDDGFLIFEKYFVKEHKIMQAVFEFSPNLPDWTTSVIGTQIRNKNFDSANVMMEYMYANKKNNFITNGDYQYSSFSEIYENIIDKYIRTKRTHYGCGFYSSNIDVKDEEIFNFLSYWVDQIQDQQERARVNVFLTELL